MIGPNRCIATALYHVCAVDALCCNCELVRCRRRQHDHDNQHRWADATGRWLAWESLAVASTLHLAAN